VYVSWTHFPDLGKVENKARIVQASQLLMLNLRDSIPAPPNTCGL
jgi:hypothetical protein